MMLLFKMQPRQQTIVGVVVNLNLIGCVLRCKFSYSKSAYSLEIIDFLLSSLPQVVTGFAYPMPFKVGWHAPYPMVQFAFTIGLYFKADQSPVSQYTKSRTQELLQTVTVGKQKLVLSSRPLYGGSSGSGDTP